MPLLQVYPLQTTNSHSPTICSVNTGPFGESVGGAERLAKQEHQKDYVSAS
ncbi:hypothetical protein [Xenorhabdus sp. SGI246]|uniref:hypothetical protein n=1 Tax=Xenorhabdus sp. SGI246 TaxID=3158263 RepID=UPI00349F281D